MKRKAKLISLGTFVGIAGLCMGIGAAIPVKSFNTYAPNSGIVLKGPESLFFITQAGDIHDGSFNEAGYNATQIVNGGLKYNYQQPKNTSFSELKHAYDLALSRGADVLFLNGFMHAQAITEYSAQHPEAGFIFLDGESQVKPLPNQILSPQVVPKNGLVNQGNMLTITYKTAQVGFIAGYLAAAEAKRLDPTDPIISGVGGQAIFSVTEFLAGYEQGMDEYNKTELASDPVKVLLYQRDDLPPRGNRKKQISGRGAAQYFNSFSPNPDDKVAMYTIEALGVGVDVFFPVGGSQVFTVIQNLIKQQISFERAKVIGVDQDLTQQTFKGMPKGVDWVKYVLGSATKGITETIVDAASQIYQTTKKDSKEFLQKGKNVFGWQHKVGLENNMVIFTGQKLNNGKTQTMEEILAEFEITGNEKDILIKKAIAAKPKTTFYQPAIL